MHGSRVQRSQDGATTTAPDGATPGASDRGLSNQLRGMSYAEGAAMLAPPPGTHAPVQLQVDAKLRSVGLKGRLAGSSYARLYDLYGKYQKEKSPEGAQALLAQLDTAIDAWLAGHDGSDKEDAKRLPGVQNLSQQVKAALAGSPSTTETTAPTETTTAPTQTPTTPETTQTAPTPEPTPTETTETSGPPAPTDAPPAPVDPILARLADPTQVLTVNELKTLNATQLLSYLDTRDKGTVEALRNNNKFITHAESLGAPTFAQVTVRILLRTPDSVVNRGASRDEAIRIMTSQLRDPEICKRLLRNSAWVVIVPKNKLMTELPEFAQWAGTYTFDGRPWDITRGMGSFTAGNATAIAEENLLGEGVADGIGRRGWTSQAAQDTALANGNTELNEAGKAGPKSDDPNTRVMNPGVYCSGYSTTNHEFFHTIHGLGLSRQDQRLIQQAYDAKKSTPPETEWADGPRQNQTGSFSENYASSTVYEYFAQTGCAFQGTNRGTDPYTGRPRNNGRSWVTANEPELAGLLARVCSDSELQNVNPRDARTAPPPTTAPPAPTATTTTTTTTTTATAPSTTPGAAPPIVGDSVAFIGQR